MTLRAARNELLFRSDADRRDFVARLCEAFAERGRCLARALLPDRAELVLRGDPPELAERLVELTRAAPARAGAANVVRREFTPQGRTPTSSGRFP